MSAADTNKIHAVWFNEGHYTSQKSYHNNINNVLSLSECHKSWLEHFWRSVKWVWAFCDFWNETLTLSISAYFSDELVVRLMSCNDEELQTHPKLWVLPLLVKCLCAMWIHGSEVININLNFGMQWKKKLHELVFLVLCFHHMHISRASDIENAACFIYFNFFEHVEHVTN